MASTWPVPPAGQCRRRAAITGWPVPPAGASRCRPAAMPSQGLGVGGAQASSHGHEETMGESRYRLQ